MSRDNDGLLVADGGDRFWHSFFPVAEGEVREGLGSLGVPTSVAGLVSAVGIYPSDSFLDVGGPVAEDASKVLEDGTWSCKHVRVIRASVTEVSKFGQLYANVEALFAYRDEDGREQDIRVAGNSRDGLRAYCVDDGEGLRRLLGS